MFVIEVVYIKCSKLFKNLECAVMVLCIINNGVATASVAILPWCTEMDRRAIFTQTAHYYKRASIWPSVYVIRWSNVGLLLGQRLRRWPNCKPTLAQHVFFVADHVVFDSVWYDMAEVQAYTTSCYTSHIPWSKVTTTMTEINHVCH